MIAWVMRRRCPNATPSGTGIDPKGDRWILVCVTGIDDLTRACIVVARSHRSTRLEQALIALGAHDVQHMGSAGLKVLRSRKDWPSSTWTPEPARNRVMHVTPSSRWRRVSDLTGAPIDYRGPMLANEHGLVVSDGRTQKAVLAKLARSG